MADSRDDGGRETTSRKAYSRRSASGRSMTRSARARAASSDASSLSNVSAWSGVLERFRLVQAIVASGASKIVRPGCGAERQKNVYMPRR